MEAAEVDQVAVVQLEAAELDRQVALVVVADLVVPVVQELVQVVQVLVQVVQVLVQAVQAVVLVEVVAVEHFAVVALVFLAQEDLPIREVGPESIVNQLLRVL